MSDSRSDLTHSSDSSLDSSSAHHSNITQSHESQQKEDSMTGISDSRSDSPHTNSSSRAELEAALLGTSPSAPHLTQKNDPFNHTSRAMAKAQGKEQFHERGRTIRTGSANEKQIQQPWHGHSTVKPQSHMPKSK